MSASIYWAPLEPPKAQDVSTTTPSHFSEVFQKAFGEWPCVLSAANIPELRAIAACGVKGVDDLIDALDKYPVIKVWSEW